MGTKHESGCSQAECAQPRLSFGGKRVQVGVERKHQATVFYIEGKVVFVCVFVILKETSAIILAVSVC